MESHKKKLITFGFLLIIASLFLLKIVLFKGPFKEKLIAIGPYLLNVASLALVVSVLVFTLLKILEWVKGVKTSQTKVICVDILVDGENESEYLEYGMQEQSPLLYRNLRYPQPTSQTGE